MPTVVRPERRPAVRAHGLPVVKFDLRKRGRKK